VVRIARARGEDGNGDGKEGGEGGPRARRDAVLQSHRGALRQDRRREGGAGLRALCRSIHLPHRPLLLQQQNGGGSAKRLE